MGAAKSVGEKMLGIKSTDLVKAPPHEKAHRPSIGRAYARGPHAPPTHIGYNYIMEQQIKNGRAYSLHGSGPNLRRTQPRKKNVKKLLKKSKTIKRLV